MIYWEDFDRGPSVYRCICDACHKEFMPPKDFKAHWVGNHWHITGADHRDDSLYYMRQFKASQSGNVYVLSVMSSSDKRLSWTDVLVILWKLIKKVRNQT